MQYFGNAQLLYKGSFSLHVCDCAPWSGVKVITLDHLPAQYLYNIEKYFFNTSADFNDCIYNATVEG